MSIYQKIDPNADIINGLVAVMTGGTPRTYDPTSLSQHLASGDSLATFRALEGRFMDEFHPIENAASDTNTAPSGADAVVYLAAEQYRSRVIYDVDIGYVNTPASGIFQVQSPSGTVIYSEPITNAGQQGISWGEGLRCGRGDDVLLVLKNGNSAKTLSLGSHGWWV